MHIRTDLTLISTTILKRCCNISIIAMMTYGFTNILAGCTGQSDGSHSEEASGDLHMEKNEHDTHHHGDLIEFDDHLAEHFGVVSQTISPADFCAVIPVSGQIEAKASDEAVATATRSGILSLSSDINVGSPVSTGETIASVNSSAVQGGDPTLQTRASRDAAKRELDRLTPLYKEGIVSAEVYNAALRSFEEADAALKSAGLGAAAVKSHKSGVITQLLAKSGEYVEAGQKIAVISGNKDLTLRADVPDKYYGQIHQIQSANFRTSASEEVFDISNLGGKLITNPEATVSQNGYIPLYFIFNNNGKVTPGAFAEVYLKSGARHEVLSVPKQAIVEISGNKCVYSYEGNGHYAKHVVELGSSDGNNVEIISGLHNDEKVVVKGAQIIRMAETSSTAVPGHTHNH